MLLLLSSLFLLSGCVTMEKLPGSKEAWISQIDLATVPDEYVVHYYKTYSSSGGTRVWNYTYYVRNEVVQSCEGGLTNSYSATYNKPCNVSSEDFMIATDIKDALPTYSTWMFKSYGETTCYYNITNPSKDPMTVFVCFNKNNIVSYGGKGGYGGIFVLWYMNDYYPDKELYT